MDKLVERKLRSAKIFRIILFVELLFTVGSFVLIAFEKDAAIMILTTTSFLLTSGLIYIASFVPFLRCVKWLADKGIENVADDISLERPTLPKSKIYCGKQALFYKKSPVAIIPYSEIAWVYLYERHSYGITVERAVIVRTKDGKKFSLNSNVDEFKWLLDHYIVKNSPDLVIGYGPEQKAKYKQLNPEHTQAEKKVKKTWGVVLMTIGTAFLVALLFTFKTAKIVPVSIIILTCLGSGLILYLLGKK